MRRDSIVDGDLLAKAWVENGRILLIDLEDRTIYVSYFVYFDVGYKFGEAFPVDEDTDDKVRHFLALSMDIRSCKLESPSLQESSSTTNSMTTGKDPS